MRTRILLPLLTIVFFFSFADFHTTSAQEVNCTIKVNYESIPTTNKDLLVNFDSDLRDYVNNYKWGPENLDDKIDCIFDISIQSVVGENRYAAKVFIGSSRLLMNGGNSAVLRLFDENWEFTYVKGRTLNHSLYTYNDLASFIDFYVMMVIGYDYDTYDKLSGNYFFQKAADIASLARSGSGKGWTPAKSGFSRTQLMDELLNAKFAPVRAASFEYHFAGLDSLGISKERALKHIAQAVQMIGDVKKSADSRNQIIRTFFNAKFKEVAELFIGYPDPKIYTDLATIDPEHQTTYEEYRKKR